MAKEKTTLNQKDTKKENKEKEIFPGIIDPYHVYLW